MPTSICIKKVIGLVLFSVILSTAVFAQTARTVPVDYTSAIPKNYVRIWAATAPQPDPNALLTSGLREVIQTTQYLDGLGRPLQTVIKQGSLITSSSSAIDLTSMVEYDAFGKETYKYLPSPANNTGSNASITDGNFKLNPFAQQAVFYNSINTFSPLSNQNETFFYGQTTFETSPLNRKLETAAPGNSWTGTMTNPTEATRRSVKMKYYTNTATDAVRIWIVTPGAPGSFSTYSSSGTYITGLLLKNISVDENGKQVIEFKDKEGKVILKKVQLTASADDGTGSPHPGWLCTYYLYDDLNNLRCIIQPKGVDLIQPGWVLTDPTIIAEQCFIYEYDQRNRMIIKKVPGAAEVYLVFDAKDRLVMAQDANMRALNKWMVTLYDAFSRPVQTGLLLNTWDGSNKVFALRLSDGAANTADYPFSSTTTPVTTYWEYLSKTGYDDYSTIPVASQLNQAIDPSYNTYLTGSTTFPDYAVAMSASASLQTKGMVTWTETKILGQSTYIYTVSMYDEKGRAIQQKSKNITTGTDIITTQYTWSGQPFIIVQKQEKAGAPAQINIVVSKITYDDLGRVIQTEKRIQNSFVNSNTMSAYSTVSALEYDALGQLKKKKLGNKPGAPGISLVNLDNEYNIRGWLLSVNKSYITAGTNTDQYFGMQLGYDKDGALGTFTNKQFNGNIGGTIWKSEGDQQKRKYDFSYDAVNRLLKADFNQYSGSAFDKTGNVDFSMQVGDGSTSTSAYDANGNIKGMKQWGLKLNNSPVIDDFTYNYKNSETSNKLLAVTESAAINTTDNKLGDFTDKNRTLDDYDYDANGNLMYDKNKAIASITYNHLNLPGLISITGKGSITYTYDAMGNKLKKVTSESPGTANGNKTITTTANYINGFVYESKTTVPANSPIDDYTDVLQFMPQEEGRIRYIKTSSTLAYDYFIKDHLGNTRMVLTEEAPTNYYPAATLEGAYDASTNSMVNYEKTFYNINSAYITSETSIASWPTETVANTKLYYNNNQSPASNVAPVSPPNLSYPASCTPLQTDGSAKLYKLNATTNRTGLEFMIKVMAGDKIDIFGKSYFLNTATVNNANSTVLDIATLMANMLLSPANAAATKGITSTQLTTINSGQVPGSFFRGANGETTTIPKAYINYILFDDQFKYAGGGASRVSTSGQVKDHWYVDGAQLSNIPVTKNGYIFVYVSNESNLDVFFDNLQVIHKPGPILEETHYYPFGLTMAGISSKAAGKLENKYGITGKEKQSKEFSDGSGLDEYDFGARFYDHQIGRWNTIDPHIANYYWLSPYNYCNNNPLKYLDPSGMDPETSTKEKPKDLSEVTVVAKPKPNNSLANRGLFWANSASTPTARLGMNRQEVYQQSRGNGFSQSAMTNAWRKKGIDDDDLARFERGYQAEVDYQNMSLIAVGSIGAPLAAITGIELIPIASSALSSVGATINVTVTAANSALTTAGIETYTGLNLAKNFLVTQIGNTIVSYGPATMMFSSNLMNVMDKGYNFNITANHISATLWVIASHLNIESLPSFPFKPNP